MKKIYIILFSIILISCKKYEFSVFEQQLYDIYNVGDTLVFVSIKTEKIVTYVITDKTNYVSRHFSDGRYREVEVNYRDVDKPIDPSNDYKPKLFGFLNNKYGYYNTVLFNDFYGRYENTFGTLKTDTISFFDKKYSDYYTLKPTTMTNPEDSTTVIYWQKKYGIVKFDLNNGDSYVRTNVP